jgi:hypothetical protein
MQGKMKTPVEVVMGGHIRKVAEDAETIDSKITQLPSPSKKNNHQLSLAFEREVDIETYPVLKSHIIDGKPVFPMALMAEWFGHGALHENPGLVLQGLDDIRILKGILLDQDKKLIRLMAGKIKKNGTIYEVDLELRDGIKAGKEVIHSKAKAILTDTLNNAPDFYLPESMTSKPYARSMADVYDKILFHGPHLHGIRNILSCTAEGMVALVSPAPVPTEWLQTPFRNRWLCDPLALDSAFQMATLWCYEEHGVVSLPSYVASYRQYQHQFPADMIKVVLQVKHVSDRKMQADFTFLDSADQVVAQMTGYVAIMYDSLFKAFKPQYAARA